MFDPAITSEQSFCKLCLALLLPLVGYLLFISESIFDDPNPVWALLLFFWALGAAFLSYQIVRGKARWVLDRVDRHASGIAVVMIVIMVAALTGVSVLQARSFSLSINSEDTAYYSQVLWNTLHGDFLSGNLQQERIYNPPVLNDLALHVSPALLILLLPIYTVVPDFLTLLIIRDVAIAVAAWPLFLLAREKIGGVAGVAAVILYFTNPAVIAQGFEAFTLLQLAPLPFFWALRAFVREEFWTFLLWMGAAMCIREEVAIAVAGFGLWALVGRRPLKWLTLTLAIPLIWWSFTTLVIQPAFGRVGNSALDVALAGGSQTPAGIYQVLLGNPLWVLDELRQGGFEYLYRLLRPVAFLGALGWEGVLAAPGLVANLFLARVYYGGSDPVGRFSILPSCALIGVAVIVVSRIGLKYRWNMGPFAIMMLLLLPSVSLVDGVKDTLQVELTSNTVRNNASAIAEAIEIIPDTASVAAPNYALPALSKRPKLFYLQHLHSYPEARPDYILLDRDISRITTNPELRRHYISLMDTLSRSTAYETVWQHGDYYLLRRVG
jgi:hypothetical protein